MLIYPTIRGLAFPVKRIPTWDTLVQQGSSGREVRLSYWANPIWHWELKYNYLKDNQGDLIPGSLDTDLTTLQGFYLQAAGRLNSFLYDDVTPGMQPGTGPWDSVNGQAIGTGDGTTTTFQLIRNTGGFTEIIQAPYTAPPPQAYLNGVAKTYGTDYAVNATGQIVWGTPPGVGVAITADFSYFWAVRFDDDNMEIDEVLYQLWELKTVKLCQVRL